MADTAGRRKRRKRRDEGQEGSGSFLKKRTKKLLIPCSFAARETPDRK
jgi:hypothetical protein